jgi:hypothetical protein
MTVFTPTHKVTIAGVEYTSEILSGGTITAGRVDIFDQTQPSYCNLELVNLSGTSPTVSLLDSVVIETKNNKNKYNRTELPDGKRCDFILPTTKRCTFKKADNSNNCSRHSK